LSYFDFDDGCSFTSSVGRFKANPWGLCDMTGNVWQWCADVQGGYPTGAVTDPQGPAAKEGSARVRRGGSWNSRPQICRAAFRPWNDPSLRACDVGFRLAVRVE
jgi:formylglycine-generating enzyme required for sulfatase activity